MSDYYTSAQVREFVKKRFSANGENYAKTGRELGVNAGTIWKIVNGKQNDSPRIRKNCDMPKRKRIRLAADFENEMERDRFREDCLRELSFTEWVFWKWEQERAIINWESMEYWRAGNG